MGIVGCSVADLRSLDVEGGPQQRAQPAYGMTSPPAPHAGAMLELEP
jgi:hypothetical protein